MIGGNINETTLSLIQNQVRGRSFAKDGASAVGLWCLGCLFILLIYVLTSWLMGHLIWNWILIGWGHANLEPLNDWQCIVVGSLYGFCCRSYTSK